MERNIGLSDYTKRVQGDGLIRLSSDKGVFNDLIHSEFPLSTEEAITGFGVLVSSDRHLDILVMLMAVV